MDFFYGDLVQNEELNKTARERKREYHELTVSQVERDSYERQGWMLRKQLTNRARLYRKKHPDELLEDEVWLLFYKMGFAEMNKDRNFRIQAGAINKQIDVFAKHENKTFVVECKASTEGVQVSRKDIHEISDLKKDITDSIKKKYSDRHIRVSFVMATRGVQWSEDNENLAKNNQIVVWNKRDLKSYSELIKHLGASAKFQIYSILFKNKKIPNLRNIKVPAILGGRGDAKYYSFIIKPEELLQVAYVHRRETTPNKIVDSYQRMIKKPRLNKIDEFISRGGYFANNIILNFTQKPTFHKFEKEKQIGDIVCGILEFPPYYGSAWIIDGQHRLYGYANNEKRMKDTVPVLAFESLSPKDQANLFVDINREQKAVTPNLLWDLYPVIYADSEEEEHQIKRAISLIARKLNSDSDSPLHDHIKIPSVLPKRKEITNLTMTTVCDAIEENRLIKKDQTLLYKDDYNSTVDFASERLKAYFDVVSKSFPEDWQKGEKGLLRSNIGIRILFIMLRQLVLYLKLGGQEVIYKKRDLSDFKGEVNKLLNPMIVELKNKSDGDRSAIRGQVGKGPLTENARRMVLGISEQYKGFGLELLRGKSPFVPSEETDKGIEQLLEDTETALRGFIVGELKKLYGKQWWQEGIPGDIKDYINQQIENQIKNEPWRTVELHSYPLEKRLEYTATAHLSKVIMLNPNWRQFAETFKDKERTLARFKSFEDLRNTYRHYREQGCDEITKNWGYWGMKWIRECLS